MIDFETRKRLLECVPSTWLDPMLSGTAKVIRDPITPDDIERVCQEIHKRLVDAIHEVNAQNK